VRQWAGGLSIDGDAPGRVAEQPQNQIARMGGNGCNPHPLRLPELGGCGCLATSLPCAPDGNGPRRVGNAQFDVGVGGETGIWQPHGDQPVIGAGRLVLVGSLKAPAGAVSRQKVRHGVSFLASPQKSPGREDRGRKKEHRTDGGDSNLPPALCRAARPNGSGEEDGHGSFNHQNPTPGVLQKAQLGQQIPDREGDGELEKKNSGGNERQENPPAPCSILSAILSGAQRSRRTCFSEFWRMGGNHEPQPPRTQQIIAPSRATAIIETASIEAR